MRQPLRDRLRAPGEVLFLLRGAALQGRRELDHPLGGALAALGRIGRQVSGQGRLAIEDDVLDPVAQFGGDLVVDADHAGVDDAHRQARLDRVIEEDGMDGLARRIVAAERERDVGHAAGDLRVRQVLADPLRRLDEVDRVVVVLLDAGGDREDVRVEDDVLGRKADLLGEELVGTGADLGLAGEGVGLALLVERHDDGSSAIAAAEGSLADELGLAFLHRDRVDDRLALDAAQPGLDDGPLRAVDHDRDAGDVGLGGDQVQEPRHRRGRVEHRLVHVDVDDLGAVLDLLAGDGQRVVVLLGQDQAGERLRAGDIGPFADVDEQ